MPTKGQISTRADWGIISQMKLQIKTIGQKLNLTFDLLFSLRCDPKDIMRITCKIYTTNLKIKFGSGSAWTNFST